MNNVVFMTGNQSKADYLSKYLGYQVAHEKVDLDELQSTQLQDIVDHKVRQAYEIIQKPVLVEDVSLEFEALGGLPGPFIKFFIEQASREAVCRMLDGMDRKAIARCMFGYYDGVTLQFFEGYLNGHIAQSPAGEKGFGGWDNIFIPDGYDVTRAELNEEDDIKTYTTFKPFEKVKRFLEGR